MTRKERGLAADFLDRAAEEFSNRSCNDFDFPESWTREEKQNFIRGYYENNGDPEEYDPKDLTIADFAAMGYLAALLRGEA